MKLETIKNKNILNAIIRNGIKIEEFIDLDHLRKYLKRERQRRYKEKIKLNFLKNII